MAFAVILLALVALTAASPTITSEDIDVEPTFTIENIDVEPTNVELTPLDAAVAEVSPRATCICGKLKRVARIVGGAPADLNEYPYQVGLIFKADNGSRSTNIFCGGTLISDRHILTAAHCTDGYKVKTTGVESGSYPGYYLTAILGGHNMTKMDGIRAKATNLISHSLYNRTTLANDIAIIVIPPLSLTSLPTGVLPACLPKVTTNLYAGTNATVTGWGLLSTGGVQPGILQEVVVPVITNAVCQATYGSVIISSTICTFTPNKGTCQGDSGGPLVSVAGTQATLIGVVSFTASAGCAVYPSGYTRVTSYQTWITSKVGTLNTCPSV